MSMLCTKTVNYHVAGVENSLIVDGKRVVWLKSIKNLAELT